MARRIKREEGIAILETSAIMVILLGILLSGWAAIDLFQRGIALSELVEGVYYDGVVNAYTIAESGVGIQVNRAGITQFIGSKMSKLASEIESKGVSSSSYALQGALIEVSWRLNAGPIVERVTLVNSQGQLTVPGSLRGAFDIESLSRDYLTQLVREGETRQSVLRPDIWHDSSNPESFISDSFALLGMSAALSVDDGLAKLLLEGAGKETILVRSSFNSLRRDL